MQRLLVVVRELLANDVAVLYHLQFEPRAVPPPFDMNPVAMPAAQENTVARDITRPGHGTAESLRIRPNGARNAA